MPLDLKGIQNYFTKNKNIKKEFGTKTIRNHTDKKLGEYSRATFSSLL